MIYRAILQTDHSEALGYPKGDPRGIKFDTGASYPGCCPDNPAACDPRQFNSFDDAANYARSKGEKPVRVWSVDQTWKMMQSLNVDCGSAPKQTVATVPTTPISPTVVQSYPGETPVYSQTPTSPDIMPSLTPTPSTTPSLSPGAVAPAPSGTIYRLILRSERNGKITFDTGATYPACSQSNPEGCQPMQFESEKAAVEYALAHGETPVRVSSEAEAWDIAEGRKPIVANQIISTAGLETGINTFLLIGGLLALLGLTAGSKKKRGS